jgi:pyruvate formate lyase activating enzyme
MLSGIVFDINEFAIHDGPGIRTTVFLKGCPLHCVWCHNPEGISPEPQVLHTSSGDRLAGTVYTPEELARILNSQADILRANEGGVTFSGGEPLRQSRFVAATVRLLRGIHILLDTSGYASEGDLRLIVALCDMVYYDLKLIDPALHRRYTGCDNAPILHNLHVLGQLGVPYVVRVPLIPGVTDTDDNLAAIAATLRGSPALLRVDLLPYNRMAGGKYAAAGMTFAPTYDEARTLNINTVAFVEAGVPIHVA